MSDEDRVPLLRVMLALANLGYDIKALSYDRLYKGAINGSFDADQVVSNRWSVRRDDLPRVAAAFGLVSVVKASKPVRTSRAAVEHAA